MSFLGRLFGTEKAVNTVVQSVSSGIDAVFYTEEEQAEYKAEMFAAKIEARKEASKVIVDWVKNTQGQNLSRRLIALLITGTWLMGHTLSMGLSVGSVWLTIAEEKLLRSSQLIAGYADNMTGAMMLILGFYFGAPYADKFVGAALNRMKKG